MDIKIYRSSGILMHISSLPGTYGIGEIGKEAIQWIDFLDKTGTKYWQILPLNPTGYGNSPYQGLSAFAGNPLFINLEDLQETGLLDGDDLAGLPNFSVKKVAFQKIIQWKANILKRAFTNFRASLKSNIVQDFIDFKEENALWLNDYAVFIALRNEFRLVSWNSWPHAFRIRDPHAISDFEDLHYEDVEFHRFLQFIFARQWQKLKDYANSKGIDIIGDIPIFMGYDCADVWAHPQLFQLDNNRQPLAIAGVPPDFFSETGQLWGNPLYDWETHKKEGYTWWIRRIKETLKTVDLIRLDHFRGFAGYYRIPADSKTAENGKWVSGPGEDLFDALQASIGSLPFIAEDLGVITPDVIALRDKYNFPGMRLMQFAFWENADHEFLPHNYPENCAAYTGTHDNDTSRSWYKLAPAHERKFCASYLGHHTANIAHEMIRAVWQSSAKIAIAPMQDFLQLGGWARMNLPATTRGNWQWRIKPDAISTDLEAWIKEINITNNRVSDRKNWPAKDYFSF